MSSLSVPWLLETGPMIIITFGLNFVSALMETTDSIELNSSIALKLEEVEYQALLLRHSLTEGSIHRK